jgi:hypothetical protein
MTASTDWLNMFGYCQLLQCSDCQISLAPEKDTWHKGPNNGPLCHNCYDRIVLEALDDLASVAHRAYLARNGEVSALILGEPFGIRAITRARTLTRDMGRRHVLGAV